MRLLRVGRHYPAAGGTEVGQVSPIESMTTRDGVVPDHRVTYHD
jgi:hypothetical protein